MLVVPKQRRGQSKAGQHHGQPWHPNAGKQGLLGVDFGGVIVGRDRLAQAGSDANMFGRRYLDSPPAEYSLEVLARLNAGLFTDRVCLISKAGPAMQTKTREWLAHVSFYEKTGISPDRLRFVLDRRDKVAICRELGVTHFVDDQISVMQALRPVVSSLYLMPNTAAHAHDASFYRVVLGWLDLEAALHGSPKTAANGEI